jgi:hypothetical protein
MMPVVKVPVLSEHKTDMQPSVSMVAKFFTKTLRFAMRLAMIVSERATQMGRPCNRTQNVADRSRCRNTNLGNESSQTADGVYDG